MSVCKESYIDGDYIETTGGSCKVYAKENIENASIGDQFSQNGLQDGVCTLLMDSLRLLNFNLYLLIMVSLALAGLIQRVLITYWKCRLMI
ncbi:hypothetical protein QWZ06_20715 [Chryseobacterium tructae]|uniref:hypothetical protein n=1 Tax=Chryseobacterium tructae TaxID=1037380 RepID=UPI0025B443C9|nr:hypothetical protein [Chryseobacterium tructae]MDN3694513.1 hypothetical protein [Chryseobacterium tructae]